MNNRQEIKGRHGTYFVHWTTDSLVDRVIVKVAVIKKFLWLFPFDWVIGEKRMFMGEDDFQVTYWDRFHVPYKEVVEKFEKTIDTKLKLQQLRNGQK